MTFHFQVLNVKCPNHIHGKQSSGRNGRTSRRKKQLATEVKLRYRWRLFWFPFVLFRGEPCFEAPAAVPARGVRMDPTPRTKKRTSYWYTKSPSISGVRSSRSSTV
eukprot:4748992-Amphidinium_carterae.1